MAQIGLDPSVLVSPDYQVQMQRAQRQAALAQALRSQSLQETPGNGGSVSWSQGLARLADALAANISNKRADKIQTGANQAYAQGMARMFGLNTPPSQQPNPAAPMSAAPQMPAPQAPQSAPAQAGIEMRGPISPGDEPLNNAPPQAAPPQPMPTQPAMPQSSGGAPSMGPMNLTGDPRRDLGLYVTNPGEYGKALIGNAAKGTAPTDTEVLMAHARQLAAQGDYQGAAVLQSQAQKAGYIEPVSVRPGAPLYDPVNHKVIFQAARVGEGQGADYSTNPTTGQIEPSRVYNIPGATEAAAAQAGAVEGAKASGRAPYDVQEVYNPETQQMELHRKSDITGGGSLNQHYGVGGGALGGTPGGGHYAAAPPIGATAAANTYGTGSAQGALETQNGAEGSQIRVQAYREMQGLLKGGLQTGPTQARMQELAEEHGLSFLAKDNAFVFNKDAALAVAQQAKALGLNSSDARFEAVARATPNMKMTPQALAQVIPVRIGMEYASQAEATANANWIAQHGPQTNPQFKNFWRQNYDPRMFTAYAQGGPQALAKAPPQLRQQWLSDYRNLKAFGVNFGQFAQ